MTSLMSLPLLTTSYYSQKTKLPTCNTTSGMTRKRLATMSLEQTNGSNASTGGVENWQGGSPVSFDRRNVLLGFAGVYGASQLGRNDHAMGAPVETPLACHDAKVDGIGPVKCCPPYDWGHLGHWGEIVDFKFPSPSSPMRVRKPAHRLDHVNLLKYKEAIRLMKALPDDDPWSLTQQAKIHCAYCNGAYYQKGYNKIPLQVHSNWLFLPFHRLYIYFFERILGKLIGDETLAIPFWNYDAPIGMEMPSIFLDSSSSLYDENRDDRHHPLRVLDYDYTIKGSKNCPPTESISPKDTMTNNMCKMRYSVFRDDNLLIPELFMGAPVRGGESIESHGSLEGLHNTVHNWTGLPISFNFDMGNFFTAARDPMFFSHHANVDRLWEIYRKSRRYKTEFNDSDWLDSSFLFYDENKQLVRVKVRDSLKPSDLRYTYEDVEIPWRSSAITPKTCSMKSPVKKMASAIPFGSVPQALDTTLTNSVIMPDMLPGMSEEDFVAVLIIHGIKVKDNKRARFDVYIGSPDGRAEDLVYAGSFSRLSHTHGETDVSLKLGITSLLRNFEVDTAENIVVKVIPREGDITIGGYSIELFKSD
ncbi:hypothetical protein HHK36_003722 [Tetracentron sinense]|uniref:Tyrosinase copper-binding domain-containing protein n=1 Tax=Tetracentron sinense TaxID=13715 RepID=A0A834ZNS4_TETSI|nr:hypothetical protein HHK36_003722 [Tetracentron sinense]